MIMIAGQLDGLESKTIHMLFCPMSLRSLPPSVCLSILIQPVSCEQCTIEAQGAALDVLNNGAGM